MGAGAAPCRGRAAPHRVAQVYLELAVLVRRWRAWPRPRGMASPPTGRRSGQGCSTCVRISSAPSDDLRALAA